MRRADKRDYHFTYKTTCILTGRYYCGMHSADEMDDDYLGSGYILRRSVKKHGEENHIREILLVFSTRKELREGEKCLIDKKMLRDPLCMNIRPGGMGNPPGENRGWQGRKHTEETKKRMSDSHVGKKQTEETKKKISRANKGKRRGTGMSGKKHSKETIKRMRKAHRGKKFSDEHRKNISKVIRRQS